MIRPPGSMLRDLSGTMRGTVRKISMPRRLVADLMHASIGVPFVSLSRPLNIRPLLEARALAADPPGWAAIFVKAFALVAKDEPVLRMLYANGRGQVSMNCRAASRWSPSRVSRTARIACCRKRSPRRTRQSLTEIDAQIRQAKDAPIDEVPAFPQDIAGDAPAAAAAPADVADRPQFRPPARQLVRQLRRHLGGGLWRRRSCMRLSPGAFILSYGVVADQDHRRGDPLGSPDYRRRPDRRGVAAGARSIS